MRPSRCSEKISTSPATDPPPREPFVPQELRELLRLLLDGPRDHLRVALRPGRRYPSDGERVWKGDGIPGSDAERHGGVRLDRLTRRLHDGRDRGVPRRV